MTATRIAAALLALLLAGSSCGGGKPSDPSAPACKPGGVAKCPQV